MHNGNCKKNLKQNKKKHLENILWLIWLFTSYKALTLKLTKDELQFCYA